MLSASEPRDEGLKQCKMAPTNHSALLCFLEQDSLFLEQAVKYPLRTLYTEFASGYIKGESLIDVSIGPLIFPLFPVFEPFREIIVLKFNDDCIKELDKWRTSDPGACDWSHAVEFMAELEGNSAVWTHKEEELKRRIKHLLKCDVSAENLVDERTVPKADCLLTAWILETISQDETSYCNNFKKMSALLKLGGHLVLIGDIQGSFFIVGGHKYHILPIGEEFLRKTLEDEGYSIVFYSAVGRNAEKQTTNYEKIVCIIARKVRER
uniref:Nicotinamide N-methyltransferase n=2 Tax=Xenopus tropicalis TaxID=8364 RepID=A0A803K890_XENTR